MLGEKKFRSGGTERGRRREGRMNVRGRIEKAGWMNADGEEVAVRQDDRETRRIERLHK